MKFRWMFIFVIYYAGLLSGCAGSATHEVITTHKAGDEAMTCAQIDAEIIRAQAVIDAVGQDKEDISGADVVDTVLWFPFNLIAKSSNYQEALDAADRRIARLQELKQSKRCNDEPLYEKEISIIRLSEEFKALNKLYRSGVLTEEEYKAAKQRVLNDPSRFVAQERPRAVGQKAKVDVRYPRKLLGKEIREHFKRYKSYTFYKAPKAKFIITIYSFNNIERYCESCIVKKGWGVMSVKQSKNQVCFNWNNVNYPSTSCFYVIQEDEKRYQLIDPVDSETYMYSVQ